MSWLSFISSMFSFQAQQEARIKKVAKSKPQKNEPVVVFTGHAWEAELLKNILENEGINAFLNNEHFGTLFPFNRPMGMGDVKVVVAKPDAERAEALVADFEKDRFE